MSIERLNRCIDRLDEQGGSASKVLPGQSYQPESPQQFRRYLLPVLDRIATDGAG